MVDKVICSANSKVVAKFRYAQDEETGAVDECMSLIVKNSAIPGVTLNAGISLQDMSPNAMASEALVLDISVADPWYRNVLPKCSMPSSLMEYSNYRSSALTNPPIFHTKRVCPLNEP